MTDHNGRRLRAVGPVARPRIRWRKSPTVVYATCKQCPWGATEADLALARVHIRAFPWHTVEMRRVEITLVRGEHENGRVWRRDDGG